VHVISRKALRKFTARYRDADAPLNAWFKLITHGSFHNLTELKQAFGSVDFVPTRRGDFHVFDIGGNKYRLIAAIHFNAQRIFVRHVLTHAEYDTGKWKS
jgi:mRNA interferase HigB